MALTAENLRDQLNGVPDADDVLTRLLAAATAHIEASLGFKVDDSDEFPDGTPADIEQAVLMMAGHFYENREASVAGVTLAVVPIGVEDIIRNHRNYTYG